MKIRMTKEIIFAWVLAACFWLLCFYSMTVKHRPAATEAFLAIFAILTTGAAAMQTLRGY